jgi:hypothetical protein
MSRMRDETWAEMRRDQQTDACRSGQHAECAHRSGMGGGLNPRRLRFEAGAGLCTCICHQSCPVADETRLTVPFRTWRERCTCPGADADRQRLDDAGIDFPDLDELMEERRRQSQASREALQAVRVASGGKTRDEIRQLYIDEMRSRALSVPPDEVIEAHLDWMAGNPLPGLRLAARSLAEVGKAIADLGKIFR